MGCSGLTESLGNEAVQQKLFGWLIVDFARPLASLCVEEKRFRLILFGWSSGREIECESGREGAN